MRNLRFPLERITYSNAWVTLLKERGFGRMFDVRDGPGLAEMLTRDGLANVEQIAIDDVTPATLVALTAAGSLPALQRLTLIGRGLISSRQPFVAYPELDSLLAKLDAPLLESIDLQKMRVSGDAVAALASNPSSSGLTALAITQCAIGPVPVLTDARLAALKWVTLVGSRGDLDNVVATLVARSPALSWLDLRDSDVGDVGVTALAERPEMSALEVLLFDQTRVGDAGVLAIARSPNLMALTDLLVSRVGYTGFTALLATKRPVMVAAANTCWWIVMGVAMAPPPEVDPVRAARVKEAVAGRYDLAAVHTALMAEGLWPTPARDLPRRFRARKVTYEGHYGDGDGDVFEVSPLFEAPLPPTLAALVMVATVGERFTRAEEHAIQMMEALVGWNLDPAPERIVWNLYDHGWWRYEPPPPCTALLCAMRSLAPSTPYDNSIYWPHAYADLLAAAPNAPSDPFTPARAIVDLGFWFHSFEGGELRLATMPELPRVRW